MPRYVVERIAEALNSRSRSVKGSRIHLVGVAYKPDVSDMRESPALDIAQLLIQRGALLSFSDPFVESVSEGQLDLRSVPIEEALGSGIDCAVITTNHQGVDYESIVRRSPIVVDTRNTLQGVKEAHIFRL